MELVRAKQRKPVEFRITIRNEDAYAPEMDNYVEHMKGFVQSVLTGNSSAPYNKLMMMEYVNETIHRNQGLALSTQLDEYFRSTIASMINQADDSNDSLGQFGTDIMKRNEQVFNHIELCWCRLRSALSELIQVFSQLQSVNTPGFSIWNNAMEYFKQHLHSNPQMKDRLTVALLDMISKYRDGFDVIFCQLRNIVEMYTFVGGYEKLEERVISETREYYRQFSSQVSSLHSVKGSYIVIQNKILREEEACNKYLLKETVDKVMSTVRIQLLQLTADRLMDRQVLEDLITTVDTSHMRVLVSLYADTDWLSNLHDALFDAAKNIGDRITTGFINRLRQEPVSSSGRLCSDYIKELYGLKTRVDTTIKDTLGSNVDIKSKEHILWQRILNTTESYMEPITMALASYADNICADTSLDKFVSVDHGISFIMKLFRALSGKSRFEVHFRSLVSSRLWYHQKLSQCHEVLVSNLREECGASYVSKMDVIFNDYKNSCKFAAEFTQRKRNLALDHGSIGFNFTCLLLSKESCIRNSQRAIPDTSRMNSLEAISPMDLDNTLPVDPQINAVKQMQQCFIDFYAEKYKNRSLSILTDLGSAVLTMDLNGRSYDLSLSLYQAYTLLSLNGDGCTTLGHIRALMGTDYDDDVMRRHLLKMADGTNPLLTFTVSGLTFDTCSDTDSFCVHPHFTADTRELNFRYREESVVQPDKGEVDTHSLEDPTPVVEATIVRHLKTHLTDSSTNVFRACVTKISGLDRFEFNKILNSLAERDFVSIDTKLDTISYIP
ncbi:Cullin family protein [Babesia bovis T2Bo]|uniref:Cullin family profile domain-containing protein n=1 Tax=Babesia bovis TaxID=5865 RepID=A7AMF9_BABBO|nr:Cullin family protein [Babesia bovis T2Bo]EDO07743.1 Cullin family protein [Babesia bovis T2Bo]|eukprot:XP_001611311.1 hypothetical protein [Babesia bovis T2Bo]